MGTVVTRCCGEKRRQQRMPQFFLPLPQMALTKIDMDRLTWEFAADGGGKGCLGCVDGWGLDITMGKIELLCWLILFGLDINTVNCSVGFDVEVVEEEEGIVSGDEKRVIRIASLTKTTQ